MVVIETVGEGLWNAFQMAWEVGWALVLGFLLSGVVQAWIPRSRMERALGGRDLRSVARATGLGAASSSCSYAAFAIAKSMFQFETPYRSEWAGQTYYFCGEGCKRRFDEGRDQYLDPSRPKEHAHAHH